MSGHSGKILLSGTSTALCVALLTGCQTTTGQKAALTSAPTSTPTTHYVGVSDKTHPASKTGSPATNSASGSATSQPSYPSLAVGSSGPAVLALNERLAELGFLPVDIAGGLKPVISTSNISNPPNVGFTWRYSNTPTTLMSDWSPNKFTVMTSGAVIALEHQYGLSVDGMVGPQVWQAILANTAKPSRTPYTYVLVTKNPAPEQMRVWQSGSFIFSTICNTGVAGARTTDGTYPVYLRLLSQTMTGTNPDGTHYSDPGVPFINYFNGGDAIHGFPRSQYGFPQSNGCVELPYNAAKTAWSLVHYGTLVTVSGKYSAPQQASSGSSSNTASSKSSASKGSGSPAASSSKKSGGSNTSSGNSTSGKQSSGTSKTGANNNTSNTNTTSGSTGPSSGNNNNSTNSNSNSSGSNNTNNSTTGNTTGNTTGTSSTNNTTNSASGSGNSAGTNNSPSSANSSTNTNSATTSTNNTAS